MESALPDAEQKKLRAEGVITDTEVAIMTGDILVAENVVTRDRRIVNRVMKVQEGRRLLRD